MPGAAALAPQPGAQPFAIGSVQVSSNDGQLVIQLEPPELGRLAVTLDPHDPSARALVAADRAATADLVRRHADLLLAGLRDAGVDAAGVDVSGGSLQDGAAGQGAAAHPPFATQSDATSAVADTRSTGRAEGSEPTSRATERQIDRRV
ncbi:MAG: flagellar hook-length control protein FliK [Pseudomonadota bacterium]